MPIVSLHPKIRVELYPESKDYLDIVRDKAEQLKSQDVHDSFIMADLGDVVTKISTWRKRLPRVQPFYAVKCNPHQSVLHVLDRLGVGFDCASKGEVCQILKMGVDPSRIIYAHPYKQTDYIRYASTVDVDLMTFDSADELDKICEIFPTARLLLRIQPPAHHSVEYKLCTKFGCPPVDVKPLLKRALRLNLNVVGLSYHIGTGVKVAEPFVLAVERAATVFQQARDVGFELKILDIGGGFPASPLQFEKIAVKLQHSLDIHFPASCDVTLMAEPGRYLVAEAFTLTATVIAKRRVTSEEDAAPTFMYYINNGVRGDLGCIIVCPKTLSNLEMRLLDPPVSKETFMSTVWGPTCDERDVLFRDVRLPQMRVGDVINVPEMGAYSLVFGTDFNGMARAHVFCHCSLSVCYQTERSFLGPHIVSGVNLTCADSSLRLPEFLAGVSISRMRG